MRFWLPRPHGTIQRDEGTDSDQKEGEERRLHDQQDLLDLVVLGGFLWQGEVLSPRQHKRSAWCAAASGAGESPAALFKLGVSKLAHSCAHLNK